MKKENLGLDFPLLIKAPKKIPITAEQFDKLSYMGLGSFLCSYPIVICKRSNEYEMFFSESKARIFHETPRFKDLKFWAYPEAEMVSCNIPFDHNISKTIEKYYSHLII